MTLGLVESAEKKFPTKGKGLNEVVEQYDGYGEVPVIIGTWYAGRERQRLCFGTGRLLKGKCTGNITPALRLVPNSKHTLQLLVRQASY